MDATWTVAVVYRAPFGETAFQMADAEVNPDQSLTILYAYPHPKEGDIWQEFKPGTWREVAVKDPYGVQYAFVAPAEQQKLDEQYAHALKALRA